MVNRKRTKNETIEEGEDGRVIWGGGNKTISICTSKMCKFISIYKICRFTLEF